MHPKNQSEIILIFISVFGRVKLTLEDTIIRIEHVPGEAATGAAIEIHIKRMEYFDSSHGDADQNREYEPPAIAFKNIRVYGLEIFCEEFPATFASKSEVRGRDSGFNLPPHPASLQNRFSFGLG
jgi:hypothetical protein